MEIIVGRFVELISVREAAWTSCFRRAGMFVIVVGRKRVNVLFDFFENLEKLLRSAKIVSETNHRKRRLTTNNFLSPVDRGTFPE